MRVLKWLAGAFLAYFPATVSAQTVCDSACEPNPTSATYVGGTFAARSLPSNARGKSSPAAPSVAGSSSDGSVTAGSGTYNYAVPILSLPGRNGFDLNLVLFYNSGIWTVDPENGKVTFNADRDFPSYGFRLGFGYFEFDPAGGTVLLTEPDGTKRSMGLKQGTSNLYQTTDGSYAEFNSATKTLRRKDGVQWDYEQIGTTTLYRPVKIKDTNGNFISISYRSDANFSKQAVNTIVDTYDCVN